MDWGGGSWLPFYTANFSSFPKALRNKNLSRFEIQMPGVSKLLRSRQLPSRPSLSGSWNLFRAPLVGLGMSARFYLNY